MGEKLDTPDPVKRLLRQESGFGCCRCGLPFLEYHHIIPYSLEAHFRPEDMIAVCATCHQAIERGAITLDEQRALKSSPHNIVHNRAKGTIYLKQDYIALDVGADVYIVGDELNLSFGKTSVLSMRRSQKDTLSLSTVITNSEGAPILKIDNNDWSSLDHLPWDIEADWRKVTIRQAARNIRFSLDATSIPMRLRGQWFWQGKAIRFENGLCELGGPRFAHLGLVGMNFAVDHESTKFGPVEGEEGAIISHSPSRERLYKCRDWLYAQRASQHKKTGN